MINSAQTTLICASEKCLSLNVEVFRQRFKTGEDHARAQCIDCKKVWFISRRYLTIDTPVFFKKPKIKKETTLVKEEIIWNDCPRCKRRFTNQNFKLDKEYYCSKRCKKRTIKKNKKNNTVKTNKTKKFDYRSKEWQSLRYETLKRYGRKCMVCFATNTELHVDHIKPISKYPHLSLDPNNLQVLCRACNMGKSNRDSIDWRQSVALPLKEQ